MGAQSGIGTPLLVSLLMIVGAAAAHGQQQTAERDPGRGGFVTAAGIVSAQSEGQRDCPYLCGPLGGAGLGATFAAGRRVTSRLSIGMEVTFAGVISGPQQIRVSGGSLDVTAKHRDAVFSSIVSVSSSGTNEVVTGALVGTAGIVRRKTGRTGVRRSFSSPPAPFEEQLTDYVPAVGGGIDVLIHVRDRLSIAPLFRLHYFIDDDGGYPKQPPKRGVSSVLWLAGVGVQVRF